MYLFSVKKEKKSLTTYAPVCILVAVLIAFVCFSNSMVNTNTAREKEILENAIDRSITQCYALEGMYPARRSPQNSYGYQRPPSPKLSVESYPSHFRG